MVAAMHMCNINVAAQLSLRDPNRTSSLSLEKCMSEKSHGGLSPCHFPGPRCPTFYYI